MSERQLTPEEVFGAGNFGGCPVCGATGVCVTTVDRKETWAYCPEHNVRWLTRPMQGVDGFDESNELGNRAFLAKMEAVEEWIPPDPLYEAAERWLSLINEYWPGRMPDVEVAEYAQRIQQAETMEQLEAIHVELRQVAGVPPSLWKILTDKIWPFVREKQPDLVWSQRKVPGEPRLVAAEERPRD